MVDFICDMSRASEKLLCVQKVRELKKSHVMVSPIFVFLVDGFSWTVVGLFDVFVPRVNKNRS